MAASHQSALVTVTVAILMMIMICSCQVSEGAADDLISKVCSDAPNPQLCDQLLRPDLRSKGSDLVGLGGIMVEKGQDAVKAAIAAIKSIPPSAETDTCLDFFTDAIDSLNDCKQDLGSRDWDKLHYDATTAIGDVGYCDDIFTDEPGGTVPPVVAEADRRAEEIIYVLLVIEKLSQSPT
ncbi:hypothetical protein ACP275_14G276100 [Erythranthe tilingii]